jgi:hypothetical protein
MNESLIYQDICKRIHKKRALWFEPSDSCLKEISDHISSSSKDMVIEWSLLQVKRIIDTLKKKYPEEDRAILAYESVIQWLHKEIKMPTAKRAILECHAVVKDITSPSDKALFHAVAQGLSSIHVKTHALGIPIYELTSIARFHIDDFEHYVNQKIKEYLDAFDYIQSKNPR